MGLFLYYGDNSKKEQLMSTVLILQRQECPFTHIYTCLQKIRSLNNFQDLHEDTVVAAKAKPHFKVIGIKFQYFH